MIEISRIEGRAFPRRVIVAEAATFSQAKEKARELYDVAFMDDDDDHDDCADFITHQGEIYAIQPKGFRL